MICKHLGEETGLRTGCQGGDPIYKCNHPEIERKCLPEVKAQCNKARLDRQKDKTILKGKQVCQCCKFREIENET